MSNKLLDVLRACEPAIPGPFRHEKTPINVGESPESLKYTVQTITGKKVCAYVTGMGFFGLCVLWEKNECVEWGLKSVCKRFEKAGMVWCRVQIKVD
jgi:hypothetical protein